MASKQVVMLVLSVVAAAFVSCSKNEGNGTSDLSPFDFRLEYTDIPAETKQSVSNLTFETRWDSSDAVAVYNATKGEINRYVVKSGAGTSIAVFTPDGTAPSYASSDELYFIYPYEAASLEGGNLYLSIYRDEEEDSFSLSSNKVFSRNDLLMSRRFKRSSLSEGNLDVSRITLYRLVALVNLTTAVSHDVFSNETIEKVHLKCKGVAGKSAVTFTNGVPSLSTNGGSEDECVFLTADAPKMASKDYLARFVPIFPVNMSQESNGGFSFILESDEYKVGFHRALNYTMKGNANVNYFLINGLFGLNPVAGEPAATTDFSWWYDIKDGISSAGSLDYIRELNIEGEMAALDGLNPGWAADDKIALYSYRGAMTTPVRKDLCSLSSTPGPAHGAFTPQTYTFGSSWVVEEGGADAYYFYSWYPASGILTGSSETVANVASVQTEGHLNDYLICWAQGNKPKTRAQVIAGSAPSFSFSSQVAVLKLTLHNSTNETVTVDGIQVKTDSGYIAGDVTLDVKTGAVNGGTSSIIDYTPAQSIVIPAGNTSTVHALAMLPNSGKLTITAYDTAGSTFILASNTLASTVAGGCYPVNVDITGYDKAVMTHDAEDFVNGLYYYGEANCLLMPAGQLSATLDVSLYKTGADHARGSRTAEYHSAAAKARVIWYEEGDESSGLILNEPSLNNENGVWTMTVTAAKNMGGNALVGLYDKADNLLWSFHVWAPKSTRIEESNELEAFALALGQVTSAADTYMYYQWGRKDPMGRGPNYSSKEPKKLFYMVEGAAPYGSKPSPKNVDASPKSIDEARQQPTVFYTSISDPYDWHSDTVEGLDFNLWSIDYKTVYDPCPKGYLITSWDLWSGITSGKVSSSPYRFTHNDLTYVTGGSRRSDNGVVTGLGEWGHYWSGETLDNDGLCLLLLSETSPTIRTHGYRASGHAVRCVKE